MKNSYPLEQAVERLKEAMRHIGQRNLITASSRIGAAMDAIAAYQDRQEEMIDSLTWMLADIDYKNKLSGSHIEDSPEVASVRELLEELK